MRLASAGAGLSHQPKRWLSAGNEPAEQQDADTIADEKGKPEGEVSASHEERSLDPVTEEEDDGIERQQDEHVLLPGGGRGAAATELEPGVEAGADDAETAVHA